MRIDILYPTLPPALNGIGDHTAHLARTLTEQSCAVRILTGQPSWTPVPDVQVLSCFERSSRRSIRNVAEAVAADPPDVLLVQFEQFSYGRWGFNPFLPWTIARIRRAHPNLRIALMAHEDYMAPTNLRKALMSTWQRMQLWTLGRLSDIVFFSIAPWAVRYRSWFPNTSVHHLPVGSNIPVVPSDPQAVRALYDIDPDAVVVGLFGSMHDSRQLPSVQRALQRLRRLHPTLAVLYVGRDGDTMRNHLGTDLRLYDAGPLPGPGVSRCFAAMDLYLVPFEQGTSTRRGSFLVALQHGVATVSTSGPETDWLLRAHDNRAFRLAPWNDPDAFVTATERIGAHPARREQMGHRARALYARHFDWPVLGTRLLSHLRPLIPSPASPPPNVGAVAPSHSPSSLPSSP